MFESIDAQVDEAVSALDDFIAAAEDGSVDSVEVLELLGTMGAALKTQRGQVFKVSYAHTLEADTRDGWTLVRTLTGTEVDDHMHRVAHPRAGNITNPNGGTDYNGDTIEVTSPVVINITSFLMRKDRSTILVALLKQRDELTTTVAAGDKQLEAEVKKTTDVQTQLDRAVREHVVATEHGSKLSIALNLLQTQHDEHVEATKDLQLQVDKVREAVGTIEWTKIMAYQDSKHGAVDVDALPDAEDPFT